MCIYLSGSVRIKTVFRCIAHYGELEKQSTEINVGLCGSDSSLCRWMCASVLCVCWDQLAGYVMCMSIFRVRLFCPMINLENFSQTSKVAISNS